MKVSDILIIITIVILMIVFGGECEKCNARNQRERFEPEIPTDAPKPAPKTVWLEDMIKYLQIVVRTFVAKEELLKLSNGYASTYTSPQLDALRRQKQFFIAKIKKDPQELNFFRENLTLIL